MNNAEDCKKVPEKMEHSEKFQEECLSIITFAAEICEMEHVVLSYVENHSTFIIAKTGLSNLRALIV